MPVADLLPQTANDGIDAADVALLEAAYDLPARPPVHHVGHWLLQPQNEKLKKYLLESADATRHIEPEQLRIKRLAEEAKTDTERIAREFQLEYVEHYLTRVESVARKRLAYFKTMETPGDVKNERETVTTDIQHWFEHYAFGYDPRARTPISIVPFSLFPTQVNYVDWLDDLVFTRRTSGIVEKARDEGATETSVRWGVYHWLFNEGFSMLLSTRKEDEVDSKKNLNTLFERIRFQIRLLPSWQYPRGFDVMRSMLGTMQLPNPENGNTLLGEAPVENMGRGGRVTAVFLDEPAFWPFAAYPQYRSLSQTSDSIILCSSVGGRLNLFADIAWDGVTRKFVMDWRDNPFKDKRWYDSLPYGILGPKMTRTTIAQEVDRNYDAAQPGKVWHFNEAYIFITQSEFLRPFIEAGMDHHFFVHDAEGNRTNQFRIPLDWRVIRTHDYGKSQGHDWGYLLGAQPREIYPLNDSHFIFIARPLGEEPGIATEQAVSLWRTWEQTYGLRDNAYKWLNKPKASWHSHEQLGLRKVLLNAYGETWLPWDTDYQTGIETIEEWWTPCDMDKVNPFRPELMGRCKAIFVAPDDEYQLAYNDRLSTWFVTMSQSEAGFLTGRKEFGAYHYPETELGKAVKAMRPVKEFDNIVDTFRGYAVNWNRKPEGLTPAEQFVQAVGDSAINWEQVRKENRPPTLEEQTRQDFAVFQAQQAILKKYGYGDDDGW